MCDLKILLDLGPPNLHKFSENHLNGFKVSLSFSLVFRCQPLVCLCHDQFETIEEIDKTRMIKYWQKTQFFVNKTQLNVKFIWWRVVLLEYLPWLTPAKNLPND
jgi:hypothetical protein